MACGAEPEGRSGTGHCFHRAHAQQQPPGSNPRWMKSGGQVRINIHRAKLLGSKTAPLTAPYRHAAARTHREPSTWAHAEPLWSVFDMPDRPCAQPAPVGPAVEADDPHPFAAQGGKPATLVGRHIVLKRLANAVEGVVAGIALELDVAVSLAQRVQFFAQAPLLARPRWLGVEQPQLGAHEIINPVWAHGMRRYH
jgi:hypothetical protein